MHIWQRLWRSMGLVAATLSLVIVLNNCSGSTTLSSPAGTSAAGSIAPKSQDNLANQNRKININTAILSELDKVEGLLGVPSLSHQIQSSRPYTSIDDLVTKGVLKPEQLNQVRDFLTTEELVLTGRAKDVDYLTKLGLMKGHLLVAQELLDRQLPKKAEPHIGHPIEEIYVDIGEQFAERNVPDFKDNLLRLQDLIKAKPTDAQVKTEFATSMAMIDRAIAALPTEERQSPGFVLAAIDGLLDTAASEYNAAISKGKIAAEIEYQDSRGFVQYAKTTLLSSIEPQLRQKDPAMAQDLASKLTTLYKAWPEPVPPALPVLTVADVTTQIKAIQTLTLPLIRSAASGPKT